MTSQHSVRIFHLHWTHVIYRWCRHQVSKLASCARSKESSCLELFPHVIAGVVNLPTFTTCGCKLQECPKRVSYTSLGGIVFTNVQMTSEFSKEEYSLVSRPIHPRWHSLSSRNLMLEILYA